MVTFTTIRNHPYLALFALVFFAGSFFNQAAAQKPSSGSNPAANLDQIRNGGADKRVDPAEWVNGNAGSQTAHYVEGHSIAYRARLTNMPTSGSVELILGYDIRHSSRNAIDYLTHYNRITPHDQFFHDPEVIDPRLGTPFEGSSVTPSTFLIPKPSLTGLPGTSWEALNTANPEQLKMTMWGGTITNIQYVSHGSLTAAQSETQIKVTFTPAAAEVLLAWGGHIASRRDWGYDANGVPNSAGGISGSPYHMRTLSWNIGNLGNQDRSLAAAAVIFCEVDGGVIAGDQTVCVGDAVNAFTSTTPGTGTGTLSYQWQKSTTSCSASFTDISGATSATFDPDAAGALAAGTYYYRRVTKSTGTLSCEGPSNCVTVVVNDVDAGVIGNGQTICSGDDPAAITFTTAATGSGTPSYQWQSSPTNNTADFTNITTGGTGSSYDPGAATATRYYRVIVTSTVGSKACSETSNAVAVVVNDVDAGVIGNGQSECPGVNLNSITFTTTPTGSGTLSYQWQKSTTSCSASFTDISGATSATFDPDAAGALAAGTYYYHVIVTSTQNGKACSETSNCVTVTVKAKPATPSLLVKEGTLCGLQSTPSIEVCSPVAGTYTFKQGTRTTTFVYPTDGAKVEFTGLSNGVAFTVSLTVNGCTSDDSDCDNIVSSCSATNKAVTSTEEVKTQTKVHDIAARIGSKSKVLAAPNPFTDKVRFTLQSDVSGQGSLEIFNMVGQKIHTVYQGHVEAGRQLVKEYNVPVNRRANLIYVFTVGDQKTTGKLLNW